MLTLIAAAFTVASVFLAGRKNIWAWPLGLAGAILWVLFALDIGDTGVLLMNAFFCVLYVYNFVTWKGVDVFGFFKRFRHRCRVQMRDNVYDNIAMASQDMCEVEPDDRLRPGDFIPCETCGATLLFRDAFPVEHVAPDFHRFLVGHTSPRHEDVLPFDIKFYCKRDRLPYDRTVYVYQRGGQNTVGTEFTASVYQEFFNRDGIDAHHSLNPSHHTQHWQQVTETGEDYD